LLEGTAFVAEGRVGGELRGGERSGGEWGVLNNIFKNGFMYGLQGFFFENCTDCTDF